MPKLTRELVATTALTLADVYGADDLSLRQVAGELNVTPMALYRYVAGKDDLLDAAADLLYAKLRIPPASAGWWPELATLARSTRQVALAHPAASKLFSRSSSGPHSRRVAEALTASLQEAGFARREIEELHEQLTAVVFALTAASRTKAAFERGLELIHAGLAARLDERPTAVGGS